VVVRQGAGPASLVLGRGVADFIFSALHVQRLFIEEKIEGDGRGAARTSRFLVLRYVFWNFFGRKTTTTRVDRLGPWDDELTERAQRWSHMRGAGKPRL
jgi:hypothetical protein